MMNLISKMKSKIRALSCALLLVLPMLVSAQAQKQVRGKVTDEKGQPVSGITVNVKGTKTATATVADGTFTISAASGNTLVFTGVSFEAKEVKVGSADFYDVKLSQTASTLGDLVVIGYGKGSRKTLTTSVTTIKSDDLNRGAISDVG